ncbi:MAG: glycosyltransferase family 2 protein [Candidatus Woesearchaeota archaeon]
MKKISIITVVFNNKKGLERTIKSVINQTYKCYEFIIIDGGSTDGTLDVIKKYSKHITTWVSEKDKGIYDAMNKGIKFAKGEYVYFLNSGDFFCNDSVLDKVYNIITKYKYDLYCGNVRVLYDKFDRIMTGSLQSLKKGQIPPHQATFAKSSYLKKNLFDIRYKSSGDLDFYCKAYKNNLSFHFFNIIVAYMPSGGMSSNKNISYKESYQVIKKYFGRYYAYKYFILNIVIEQSIKKLLLFLRLEKLYKFLLRLKLKGFKK